MSLSIEVGILDQLKDVDAEGADYYRQMFTRLNPWLLKQGLAEHHEPETLAPGQGYSCGFGYSMIHTLRRVAVHLEMKNMLPAPASRREATEDPLVERCYGKFPMGGTRFDHLLFHADAEGLYLPQKFHAVLLPPQALTVPGPAVGSAAALLEECTQLARAIGIPADIAAESDTLLNLMENDATGGSGWMAFATESYVCLHLIGASRAAMESGAAVVFS